MRDVHGRRNRWTALVELGSELWPVVEQLPVVGRVFMAAHLAVPRPDDPLLSGWQAVNCIRQWRIASTARAVARTVVTADASAFADLPGVEEVSHR